MEINIDAMEIIADLKQQIGELMYTNSILNIKCAKLTQMVEELQKSEE